MEFLNYVPKDFPRSEIWRLCTDGWQQDGGPVAFSAGFLKGAKKGFSLISEYKNAEITPGLIENIYRSAYEFDKNYDQLRTFRDSMEGMYGLMLVTRGDSSNTANFAIGGISPDGIEEFIDAVVEAHNNAIWHLSKVSFHGKYAKLAHISEYMDIKTDLGSFKEKIRQLVHKSGINDPLRIGASPLSKDKLIQYIEKILREYYDKIKVADTDDKKLGVIVKTIRALHQLHPFSDGNGRTFIFLLKNLFLIQNNFPMMITQTPFHFSGFSTNELVQECKDGMELFKVFSLQKSREMIENSADKKMDILIQDLNSTLSSTPMIACAQLNELFLQIIEGAILIPEAKANMITPAYNAMSKTVKTEQIVDLIKNLYIEKMLSIIKTAPQEILTSREDALICRDMQRRVYHGLLSQFSEHKIVEEQTPDNKLKIIEKFEEEWSAADSKLRYLR